MNLPLLYSHRLAQVLALAFVVTCLAHANKGIPVGGGILHAGLDAEYFDNPAFDGKSLYQRRDVRVRFDWGDTAHPIGSNRADLRHMSVLGFSVRWTGQISSRFAETYSFKIIGDDIVRFSIKPSGSQDWIVLVDSKVSGTHQADYAMTERGIYDVKLEYANIVGPARIELRWSSPSTPEEIIDAATPNCNSGHTTRPFNFADAMRCGSTWGAKKQFAKLETDAQGWPSTDFKFGYNNLIAGRNLLQFRGQANVTISGANFFFEGKPLGATLPKGTGYDPKTNLTTAEVVLKGELGYSYDLSFTETQREPEGAVGTGVTLLKMMHPTAIGSDQHYPLGTAVNDYAKAFLQNYRVLRWYHSGIGAEQTWDQRTTVYDMDHFGKIPDRWIANIEDLILLSNEMGRDLYIATGWTTRPEYIRKLTQVIQYGSDGREPYTQPTRNPVYPPLNSNLRFYIEWGNENWNYGQWKEGFLEIPGGEALDIKENYPSIAAINYDGNNQFNTRFQAWKTVEMAQSIESVIGREAMNDRVRVLLFGQYDQATKWFRVTNFVDDWFNNGGLLPEAAKAIGIYHTDAPRPLKDYIWGGGGAHYFGSENSRGELKEVVIHDDHLNEAPLPPGVVTHTPENHTWSFIHNAGIMSSTANYQAFMKAFEAPKMQKNPDKDKHYGYHIKTGAKPIYLYFSGAYNEAGGSRAEIFNAKTGIAERINLGDLWKWQERERKLVEGLDPRFDYSETRGTNVSGQKTAAVHTLSANTEYWIVAQPGERGKVPEMPFKVEHGRGFEWIGAITATNIKRVNRNRLLAASDVTTLKPGAFAALPIQFLYLDEPQAGERGTAGVPPAGNIRADRSGNFLYVSGQAEIDQTITLNESGYYSLSCFWSHDHTQPKNSVRIYLGDQEITTEPIAPQGLLGFWEGSSPVFKIDRPTTATLRIVGQKDKGTIFFSEFSLNSANAFFGALDDAPNFPGSGEAFMEIPGAWFEIKKKQVDFANAYGIVASSYEGGNATGGDRGQTPFMDFLKFIDPRATQAEIRSINAWSRMGGSDFQHHYPLLPQSWNSVAYSHLEKWQTYPQPKGTLILNATLPPETDLGAHPLPVTLTCHNFDTAASVLDFSTSPKSNNGGFLDATKKEGTLYWFTWDVVAPKSGEYDLSVNTGEGGTFALFKDGNFKVVEGTSGQPVSAKAFFTKGIHAITLRVTSGKFEVKSIAVTERL